MCPIRVEPGKHHKKEEKEAKRDMKNLTLLKRTLPLALSAALLLAGCGGTTPEPTGPGEPERRAVRLQQVQRLSGPEQ